MYMRWSEVEVTPAQRGTYPHTAESKRVARLPPARAIATNLDDVSERAVAADRDDPRVWVATLTQ